MSRAGVKKILKTLSSDELTDLILQLYDVRPEAKEYLEYWGNPDIEETCEKYRIRIFKFFFMSEGKPRKNPDFKELKTQLKYFSTLYMDVEEQAAMKMYSLEIYTLWLESRTKVMAHEKRVNAMCMDLREYVEANQLEDMLGLKFNKIAERLNYLFERGDLPDRRGWRRWIR